MCLEECDEEMSGGEAEPSAPMLAMSAALKDLKKRTETHAAVPLRHVQKMHDMSVGMGAVCAKGEAAKATPAEDLAKAATAQSEALTKLQTELSATQERLKKLESQPAPSKTVLRVLAKTADNGGQEPAVKLDPVYDAMGKVDPIATVLKAIHAQGGRPLVE